MTKTLKNSEIMALYKSLKNLPPQLTGIKFLYAASRTAAKMKSVASPLEKVENSLITFRETNKDFQKLESERIELAKKFAQKDEHGEPITKYSIIGGVRQEVFDVSPEEEPELEKQVLSLQKKYKKAFEAEKKLREDLNKLMEETNEIEVYEISLNEVPEEIQAGLFNQIFHIIREE